MTQLLGLAVAMLAACGRLSAASPSIADIDCTGVYVSNTSVNNAGGCTNSAPCSLSYAVTQAVSACGPLNITMLLLDGHYGPGTNPFVFGVPQATNPLSVTIVMRAASSSSQPDAIVLAFEHSATLALSVSGPLRVELVLSGITLSAPFGGHALIITMNRTIDQHVEYGAFVIARGCIIAGGMLMRSVASLPDSSSGVSVKFESCTITTKAVDAHGFAMPLHIVVSNCHALIILAAPIISVQFSYSPTTTACVIAVANTTFENVYTGPLLPVPPDPELHFTALLLVNRCVAGNPCSLVTVTLLDVTFIKFEIAIYGAATVSSNITRARFVGGQIALWFENEVLSSCSHDLTITDSEMMGQSASAVQLFSAGLALRFRNVRVTNQPALSDATIIVTPFTLGNATFENCLFTGNSSIRFTATEGDSVVWQNSTFAHSETLPALAMSFVAVNVISMSNVTFNSNLAGALQVDIQQPSSSQTPPVLNITASRFASNVAAYGLGGALLLSTYTKALITDSVFTDNTAPQGGALAVTSSSAVKCFRCVFQRNSASLSGGAVYAACDYGGTNVLLDSSTLTNNAAGLSGGALHLDASSWVTIRGGVLASNRAVLGGAAYLSDRSKLNGVNGQWTANSASSDGGAIMSSASSLLTSTNATFKMNNAVRYGGAIHCSAPGIVVSGGQFHNNYAGYGGGALSLQDSYLPPPDTALLRKCSFVANTLAVHESTGGAVDVSGKRRLQILSCVFHGNSAPRGLGGALHIGTNPTPLGTPSPEVVFSGTSVFQNNRACQGGAIAASGAKPSNRSRIEFSFAAADSSIQVFGNTAADCELTALSDQQQNAGGGIFWLYGVSDVSAIVPPHYNITDNFVAGNGTGANIAAGLNAATLLLNLAWSIPNATGDPKPCYSNAAPLSDSPRSSEPVNADCLGAPHVQAGETGNWTGSFGYSGMALIVSAHLVSQFDNNLTSVPNLEVRVSAPATADTRECWPTDRDGLFTVRNGESVFSFVLPVELDEDPFSQSSRDCTIMFKSALSDIPVMAWKVRVGVCPPGYGRERAGTGNFDVCVACDRDHYSIGWHALECAECSKLHNADCAPPVPVVVNGYWLVTNTSLNYADTVRCPPGVCVNATCADGREVPAADNIMCGKCLLGFTEWNGKCLDCSDTPNLRIIIGSVFVTVFYVAVLHVLVQWAFGTFNILVFFMQIGVLVMYPEVEQFEQKVVWATSTLINIGSAAEQCPFAMHDVAQIAGYSYGQAAASLIALAVLFIMRCVFEFVRERRYCRPYCARPIAGAIEQPSQWARLVKGAPSRTDRWPRRACRSISKFVAFSYSRKSFVRSAIAFTITSLEPFVETSFIFLTCRGVGLTEPKVQVVERRPEFKCDSDWNTPFIMALTCAAVVFVALTIWLFKTHCVCRHGRCKYVKHKVVNSRVAAVQPGQREKPHQQSPPDDAVDKLKPHAHVAAGMASSSREGSAEYQFHEVAPARSALDALLLQSPVVLERLKQPDDAAPSRRESVASRRGSVGHGQPSAGGAHFHDFHPENPDEWPTPMWTLSHHFRPRYFWWELWALARRVPLLIVMTLNIDVLDDWHVSRLMCTCLLIVYLMLHMAARPFAHPEHNNLEAFSLGMLCILSALASSEVWEGQDGHDQSFNAVRRAQTLYLVTCGFLFAALVLLAIKEFVTRHGGCDGFASCCRVVQDEYGQRVGWCCRVSLDVAGDLEGLEGIDGREDTDLSVAVPPQPLSEYEPPAVTAPASIALPSTPPASI